MTITTYDDLKKWFYSNSRKGAEAPYWTLYGQAFAAKDTIVARNDYKQNLDESYQWLEETIRRVNNPEGQRFRVFQVDTPGGNNGVAQVYFQTSNTLPAHVAAIGSLPGAGFLTESDFLRRLQEEKSRWELEQTVKDLQAKINEPAQEVDPFEKTVTVIERLANTPIGLVIISKITGVPASELLQGINGVAGSDEEIPQDDQQFYDNIQASARTLGVSEHTLAAKMRRLIERDPDTAKSILNYG